MCAPTQRRAESPFQGDNRTKTGKAAQSAPACADRGVERCRGKKTGILVDVKVSLSIFRLIERRGDEL